MTPPFPVVKPPSPSPCASRCLHAPSCYPTLCRSAFPDRLSDETATRSQETLTNQPCPVAFFNTSGKKKEKLTNGLCQRQRGKPLTKVALVNFSPFKIYYLYQNCQLKRRPKSFSLLPQTVCRQSIRIKKDAARTPLECRRPSAKERKDKTKH